MRKLLIVALATLALLTTGCMKTIEPGNVGIQINKVGTNRGVSKDNLVSGWVFYFPPTTKIIEYPVFNQRVAWTRDANEGSKTNEELTFQTKDNVPVSMDIAVNYTLREDKVPEFYTKFRADKISYFTHGFLRDQARNAVTQIGSEYLFDDVNGLKKEEFLAKVNEYLAKSVAEYGVVINKNGLSLIGTIRVPDTLRNAIAARVQAIQTALQAENELRVSKANAAKEVAKAEGEAAAMRAKSASITPQFMELKRLEIQQEWVHKWNGKMPDTMLGSSSNTMFMLGNK